MMLRLAALLMTAGVFCCRPAGALAVDVPTIEDFDSDVANWADSTGLALLTHVANGGPDGSGYASTNFVFDGAGGGPGGNSVVLFRAQEEFNSSGNAFVGNWVADQINRMSAYVRHSAPVPLTYFARFSGPGNFPGGTAVRFAPVFPNVWTELDFNITPSSPQFVTFEGSNFHAVFSNLGHIQLGVSIPASLANDPTAYAFGLDQVVAVPEPTSGWLLASLALVCSMVRRRRSRAQTR
jgi:hypothetical protein